MKGQLREWLRREGKARDSRMPVQYSNIKRSGKMKRKLAICILTAALAAAVSGCGKTEEAEAVSTEESGQAVSEALTSLPNLTTLDLCYSTMFNKSALSELKSVKTFRFTCSDKSDMDFISGMVNLEDLYITNGGSIGTFDALAGLPNLTTLHLTDVDSRGVELNGLGNLKALRELELEGHNIGDLNFLAGLPQLTKLGMGYEISIDGDGSAALSNLRNLTELNISRSIIKDSGFLAAMPNLAKLDLSYGKIVGINALSGLTNLTELNLSGCWVFDGIDERGITVNGRPLDDVSALSGLTNLTELNLSSNSEIVDISALSGLTKLEKLDLRNCNLTDLSPLSSLTNLKELNLLGNRELTDYSPVSFVPELLPRSNW